MYDETGKEGVNMALSENIKARRTQLKMSQEYVADQLGISRQAVAKWEAGTSEPTSKNLSELAFLLKSAFLNWLILKPMPRNKRHRNKNLGISSKMPRCFLEGGVVSYC
ncbi:MAG: helix-turn-helix domain-containing protein [Eisenbergiella sp.]